MKIRLMAAAVSVATMLHAPAHAQGLLDRLKSKVRHAVEDKAAQVSGEQGGQAGQAAGADAAPSPAASNASSAPSAPAGAPPDGRWQGQLTPAGKKSIGSAGGLEIVLAGGVRLLRYSQLAQRCLAELDGGAGKYEAAFITGRSVCGTRASVRLGADGGVSLTWEDAPNTPADQKIYAGKLRRLQQAWPRDAWSLGAAERERFDVVGYRLGMSYEDALARMKSDPNMQHEWRAIVTANGKGTISTIEKLKKGKGGGIAFTGDTLSLQFEAQTPAEMKTKTKSRPEGADAQLLVIYRTVTFPNNARPNVDKVTAALIKKYGEPSIRTDDRQALEWAFDADGHRIAAAAKGPCDQATRAGRQNKSTLTHYYGPIPGWVAAQCGLTVIADLAYQSDGGLYQMRVTVFDQRRLLGDGWYQTVQLGRARIAAEKAALQASKAVATPDL